MNFKDVEQKIKNLTEAELKMNIEKAEMNLEVDFRKNHPEFVYSDEMYLNLFKEELATRNKLTAKPIDKQFEKIPSDYGQRKK